MSEKMIKVSKTRHKTEFKTETFESYAPAPRFHKKCKRRRLAHERLKATSKRELKCAFLHSPSSR